MISLEAQKTIEELFAIAGITRVISLDDAYANEYPVEHAIAYGRLLSDEGFTRAFGNHLSGPVSPDLDIRANALSETWQTLTSEQKRQAMEAFHSESLQAGEHPEGDALDDPMASVLPELFRNYDPHLLSLAKWQAQKTTLVSNEMPLTLVLVDEDFSGESAGQEEGLKLIKELLAGPNKEQVLCGLLSHKYQKERVHEDWKRLCEKFDIDKSRFVLIPKAFLSDDLVGFARLVKLVILNGSVEKLKQEAVTILRAAIDQSSSRFESIDIYDFDQIVFRSSFQEGVWEPDTLFRIFGLFHRDETRKRAKADEALHKLADTIRSVSQIAAKSESAPNYNTIQLQRLELYEDADYLNSHYMPIDVGDIFELSRDGQSKRFMLLAQSCDLMVRSDGTRHPWVTEALVAEIVSREKETEGFARLPFFTDDKNTNSYVAFRKAFSIGLLVLDFCSYQADGRSKFNLSEVCPKTVIPAWQARHKAISDEVQRLIAKTEAMVQGGMKLSQATLIAGRFSNHKWLVPTIDIANKTLSYELKRVQRLRQPRAAAFLARYSNFLSRYAFEHDLGDRESPQPTEA